MDTDYILKVSELVLDDNGMPHNPLYWAWAAGGTNEALERLAQYCLDKSTVNGIEFECCQAKGHEGMHKGYGLSPDKHTEFYAEWLNRLPPFDPAFQPTSTHGEWSDGEPGQKMYGLW